MRILISALLLALTGNSKRDTICSTGDELTDSYLPAALQVLDHYLNQLDIARSSDVPIIEVAYHGHKESQSDAFAQLGKLSSVLDEEASDQGLANCRGFSSTVVKRLDITSKSTASDQLTFILSNVLAGELRKTTSKTAVQRVLDDLKDPGSEMRKVLTVVNPLRYLSDLSLE